MFLDDNFKLFLSSCDAGIIILDQHYSVVSWNRWMVEHAKIEESFAVGKTLKEIFKDDISRHLESVIKNCMEHGQSGFLSPRLHKHPLPLYRKQQQSDQDKIFQKVTISRVTNKHNEKYCFINVNDVSASILREKQLLDQTHELKIIKSNLIESNQRAQTLAFHDSLTNLANRHLFNDHFNMALAQAKRQKKRFSVLLIDLDFFKQTNDAYGHDVGDKLLQEVSNRINKCIRESDTAARLGGDEFAIIQTDVKSIHGAATLAKKIINSISEPININDLAITSSCSIGVSIYPDDGVSKDQLLKNADLALYHTKDACRSNWAFYSGTMRDEETKRQLQRDKLYKAIKNDKILVHYQPEICFANKKISCLETLARYIDEEGNIIMPFEFIEVAEEYGLINEITNSILKTVCNSKKLLEYTSASRIAINLSAKQFFDHEIIQELFDTHKFLNKNNSGLEIEITESILIKDPEHAIEILNTFAEKGISIALDDFGTGYSSLQYLSSFPIKKLKIDRTFIRDIGCNDSNEIITNSIISLGHNLGLQVVAEGVETLQHQNYLVDKNCDFGQGYFYSKPVDNDGIISYCQESRAA